MENKEPLQQLAEIRSMMERSSRFISLSGLSGILAGTYALLGAAFVKYYPKQQASYEQIEWNSIFIYLVVAAAVMGISLLTGFILTMRRARTQGRKLVDKIAIRMMVNLVIPIATGGFVAVVFLYKGHVEFIAPTMLIFYGLGLINGSKYTLDDIRYLGISELILGMICMLDLGHGLIYWAIGFGVLHMVYGTRMWWKYERPAAN
jgi:hypothetical protein